MKFILIQEENYFTNNKTQEPMKGLILLNLDHCQEIVIEPSRQTAIVKTLDNKMYHLSKDETLQLLIVLSDPDIVKASEMNKIHKSMKYERKKDNQ